jgi:(p)ppGpp synthase/HD superfamily hydrolase
MKNHSLAAALEWAEKVHSTQKWKNTSQPFLHHPLAVAALVLFYGGDFQQAQAALLHDLIGEGVSCDEIAKQFGEATADLVRVFEDPPEVSVGKWEWSEAKKAYLKKVESLSERSLLVIACEELHELTTLNLDLKSLGRDVWNRYPVPGRDVGWYFRTLLNILYPKLNEVRSKALVSEFATQTKLLSNVVFEGMDPSVRN